MNRPISLLLLAFTLILLIMSCVDKIILDGLEDRAFAFAIEGRIVKGDEVSFAEVNIAPVFNLTTESKRTIPTRAVSIIDSDGNEMPLRRQTRTLHYAKIKEDSPIQAVAGNSYKVHVELPDGRIYESELDVLRDNHAPESIYFSPVTKLIIDDIGNLKEVNRNELRVNTSWPKGSGGLLWEVSSTYKITDTPLHPDTMIRTCYIDQMVNREDITLLKIKNANAEKVIGQKLATIKVDYRFYQGIYYHVKQFSLSEEAYGYLLELKKSKDFRGTLFEDPLNVIRTNIKQVAGEETEEEVLGFFYATHERVLRISGTILSPLTGMRYCPKPRPDPNCPMERVCCRCTLENNSTTVKPDYWEE